MLIGLLLAVSCRNTLVGERLEGNHIRDTGQHHGTFLCETYVNFRDISVSWETFILPTSRSGVQSESKIGSKRA